MTSAIGVAILVVVGIWLFGSLLARCAGVLFIVAGSVGLASTGNANGLLLVALGIALWLVGHLLYRMRRGAWKSGWLNVSVLPYCRSDPRIHGGADWDKSLRAILFSDPNPGG